VLPLFLFLAASAPAQPSPRELIDAGHCKRARALVEARQATDAETLYLMATVKQHWHDLDAAQKFAERAVGANPKSADYHYRLSDITGEKAQNASMIHQIGLGRMFKKECDAALAIDPNHIGALKNMLQFHLHAPSVIGGDKAQAQAIADHLMKLDPVEGFDAQIEIARTAKQQGRVAELIRNALATPAETYAAHLRQGTYLGNQGKFEESERHAREAIRIHPDRAVPRALLAALLVREDKLAGVDTVLTEAEKADPDNLYPYYRAANNLLDRKIELPRAERYFRKYLSQEPEPQMPSLATAHWRLSLVLEQQGRKPESAAEFQTAVKLDPAIKKR